MVKITSQKDKFKPDKKSVVLGVIERDGKVVLKHIKSASVDNMVPFIEKTVQIGTRIITDESRV